jgi:sulfate-transporting ATPase
MCEFVWPFMILRMEEQADVLSSIEQQQLWDLDRRTEQAMRALRCPPADSAIQHLSGGERRRIALCRLLLEEPDMLLLDEPTNHLDSESVAWLEIFLQNYRGTVCAITHDRYFLDNVARWILEIDNGKLFPFSGNYSAWLGSKHLRQEAGAKKNEALERVIERELEWIQANKNRGHQDKARLRKYDELVEEQNMIEKGKTSGKLIIPPGPRLGKDVIKCVNVRKVVDGRVLLDDLTFQVLPGAIVGVVGPNGTGKTTLFKLITKALEPDAGTIQVGDTVAFGYVQQLREGLDPNNTIYMEISQGMDHIPIGHQQMLSRSYVAQFNFRASEQEKRIHMLSGGERNRVHLAKMLRSGCNVLFHSLLTFLFPIRIAYII